jgi:hypothetical protein
MLDKAKGRSWERPGAFAMNHASPATNKPNRQAVMERVKRRFGAKSCPGRSVDVQR